MIAQRLPNSPIPVLAYDFLCGVHPVDSIRKIALFGFQILQLKKQTSDVELI